MCEVVMGSVCCGNCVSLQGYIVTEYLIYIVIDAHNLQCTCLQVCCVTVCHSQIWFMWNLTGHAAIWRLFIHFWFVLPFKCHNVSYHVAILQKYHVCLMTNLEEISVGASWGALTFLLFCWTTNVFSQLLFKCSYSHYQLQITTGNRRWNTAAA
jgi:hypothetical protein